MRRFLQLTSNTSLLAQSRQTCLAGGLPQAAQRRALSVACADQSKRDDSKSSHPSGSKSSSRDASGKKSKGLLEMATDKLSEMSGGRVGGGSGSNSRSTRGWTSDRQTRSSTSSGSTSKRSGSHDGRHGSGGSLGKSSSGGGKRGGDMARNHRAMSAVRHDKAAHRFTLDLGNNQLARIDYKPIGKNMIEMFHTEVPAELRGRGIGKSLAKGALECASRDRLKLKVTCDYLEDYVKRFADEKYKKLLAK